MSVKIIDDKALWDAFIDSSPTGMLFHKWDFLRLAEKYGGGKLACYGIYREQELLAVLPVFYKTDKGVRLAYSPPQSSLANMMYLGPVVSPAFDLQRHWEQERDWHYIVNEADRTIRDGSPNFITLGLTTFFQDVRPFIRKGYNVEVQHTYALDIGIPLDKIWEGFDTNCRKNINSCIKNGFSLKPTNDVHTFYKIMREDMIDKRTFYHRQDTRYLEEVIATFHKNVEMFFVYNGSEIAGIHVAIRYKDRVISWMGTAAMRGQISANEFLVWELIKKAKADGYRVYENAGADEKRLNPFKSKFNSSLETYFQVTKKDALYKIAKFSTRIINKTLST